ncbi:CheR family methyltransferase [Permianibacter aggregans]|uniref:Chemotaxis protein methyltransferase n=1 Tax=Permianibacter aggregans TaxID=1510150 RepID=A0A4R6UI01_9GAMM|nr:CheR family methyltransferase [Permianibacter aggregans]TDQ46488.1 CheR-type MCP methyltransferase [Permianibacter aggregans]
MMTGPNSETSSKREDRRREFPFSSLDFERARTLIYQFSGIALSASKNELVYSRLVRRVRALGLASLHDYLNRVEQQPEERTEFVNALTTNLTSFFREAHHFELLAKFLQQRSGPVRIWTGATSTGEEAYSIAITAIEAFGDWQPPVTIMASDVDSQVLNTARQAVYPIGQARNLSAERLRQFFQRGKAERAELMRVKPVVQQLVRFSLLNLQQAEWPLSGKFDAIFLRNVFIYFDKGSQYRILQKVKKLLAPDGLLFVGHSETLPHAQDLFRLHGKTVYRHTEAQQA